MEEKLSLFKDQLFEYAPKLIGAIIVLIIGLWIIGIISKMVRKLMDKRDVDPTLKPFIKSLVSATLKILLLISVISMVGVEMTSFVAILAAVGLAVGMALSGTLQNFAGGVMILLFKPFKVGDYIEAQGHSGTVREIQIFNTILKSPDNKTIIIPNGGLSTNSMVNYSTEKTRRVDWTFGIAYGDKIEDAKKIIMDLIEADPNIMKDPAPFVEVSELADSSVNFAVRAWTKSEKYWDVFFPMNENIYNKFNASGINIPFPQMDVHVHNKK
jgi:small conductance mechanosensitive channel